MDRRTLHTLLSHAAAAAGRSPAAAADADLLDRFRRHGDGTAFAELVRRYARLVWAACRHQLPSDADAEDAFQATFLALVRSAGSVRDAGRLGPWLHGVAVRVCAKARRSAARRARRETAAAATGVGAAVPDSGWDAALAAVHEEAARLPDALRVPFVLCCLEGRRPTDAAARLGWKLSTLAGRLDRAKRRVLARLDARGVTAGAAAAAAVGVAAGAPAGVAGRAAGLVLSAAAVPAAVLHLSQGVVGMSIRAKLVAAAVVAAGGLSISVGAGAVAQRQPPPGTAATAPASPRPAKGAPGYSAAPPATRAADPAAATTDPRPTPAATAKPRFGSAAKWEYDFERATPKRSAEFVEVLRGREAGGWEFLGQVGLRPDGDGPDVPHWAFRRSVARPTTAVFTNVYQTRRAAPAAANTAGGAPGAAADQADRAAALDAQIAALQAERARLGAAGSKSVVLSADVVGSDPAELMGLLEKLAARRFGGRPRLDLAASNGQLVVSGDAAVVDWVADVASRLTAGGGSPRRTGASGGGAATNPRQVR